MIEKSDFAHMLASMEAYFNSPDWAVSLITGMTNGIFSKAKNLGYAGDIYGVGSASPSLGPDDYMADLDAVNLAVLSGNSEDIFKIWGDYFSGIEDGTINRASDFATNLGNGDKEKGKELLEKEVNKFVKSKNRTIHIGNKTINIGKKTDTSVAVMFLNNILDENNELVR